jgi:hypothetical protein
MNKLKGFMLGCVTTLVLMFGVGVFGESVLKTIQVVENSVTIQVNGVDLKSPNFVYDGRTYVQLRDVTNALSKDIKWNPDTKSINIMDRNAETGLPTEDIKDSVTNSVYSTPKETKKEDTPKLTEPIETSPKASTNIENSNIGSNVNSNLNSNNVTNITNITNIVGGTNTANQNNAVNMFEKEKKYALFFKDYMRRVSNQIDFVVKGAMAVQTKQPLKVDYLKLEDQTAQLYRDFKDEVAPQKFLKIKNSMLNLIKEQKYCFNSLYSNHISLNRNEEPDKIEQSNLARSMTFFNDFYEVNIKILKELEKEYGI